MTVQTLGVGTWKKGCPGLAAVSVFGNQLGWVRFEKRWVSEKTIAFAIRSVDRSTQPTGA